MIIFLYGPDSYRRNEELRNIIEGYKREGVLVERFDFSEARTEAEARKKLDSLEEFTRADSLFATRKSAVLSGLFEWDVVEIKAFLKGAVKAKGYTLVLSEEEAGSGEYPFLRGKSVDHRKFEFFKGVDLQNFINEEARARGIRLMPIAVRALEKISAGSSWFIVTELEKLRLHPLTQEGKAIDVNNMEAVADWRGESNLFAFINGVERLLPSEKIVALEHLFLHREEPAKIFNILAVSRYLTSGLLRQLADYDVAVKSGKLEYDDVLLELALS